MPNNRSLPVIALAAGLAFGAVSASQAQTIVFSDDFDSYSSPSVVTAAGTNNGYKILYGASTGVSDFSATFGYDYSANSIPVAPNTTNGSTKGLKLVVNKDATAAVSSLNLYPTNKSFSGSFSLQFDLWINWGGAVGTTEHALFGINHSGNVTNRCGATGGTGSDGLFFAMDGDGGSSATSTTLRDYSVFRGASNAVPVLLLTNTAAPFSFGPTPPLGGRFSAGDAGFQGLFSTSTPLGSAGNQWVQVEVRYETNYVTWSLNGTIVAQYANVFTYSSGDILIGYEDAFSSIGDASLDFAIFDNIRVTALGGPPTVSVTAPVPTATEGGASGLYTITRGGDTSSAITINYLMSGTASNGLDYTTLPGSVTLAAGATSTNITLTALPDLLSEPVETAVLTLDTGSGYSVSFPSTATILIFDTNNPAVSISVKQPVLLEGVSNAVVPMTLTRFGQTNVALSVNVGYAGTATRGADFNAPLSVSMGAGVITATFNMTPIDDSQIEGTETAIVSVLPGAGYAVGSAASITNTIVDDEVLPGVALFFDPFDSGSSSNSWYVNQSSADTYAQFGYDYSVDGIPEAPTTPAGAVPQHGLKFRVNEINVALAGISASPTNESFATNYQLRFDMWMNYAGPLNNANVPGQTQASSAGVGVATNEAVWPFGFATMGVWFSATCDGGGAAVAGDYNAYGTTTLFADASGVYAAGTTNGPRDNLNAYYAPWPSVSAPASVITAHPTETGTTGVGTFGMAWHKVLITKRGSLITWDIDGRNLAAVDAATNSVPLGNSVFVGMWDPFTSVTTNAAVQFALFDNVRVESLGRPQIMDSSKVGTTVTISFLGEAGDVPADFQVQTAPAAAGTYVPIAATINQIDSTHFTATVTSAGGSAYFRIHRL